MNENFSIQVSDYLKDKFPNHKESEYYEAVTCLCALLIIERDKQLKIISEQMSRGRKR